MNYTLHQLQIFVKVWQLKSITKASEEMFLTQPAVSIQLKKLQEQFDIPLTEIIGRQLHVTEFGEKIAAACIRILDEAQNINNTVKSYKGLLSGKIKISVVSTGKYIIPYYINDFLRANSGIDLSVDVTNRQRVLQSLENNEIDFALVSLLPYSLNIQAIPLFENRLHLVGSGIGKYEVDTTQSIEEILSSSPLIFREEGSATRQAMEEYLSKFSIKSNTKLELVSNEAVKQAVISGIGLSVLPYIGMRSDLKSNRIKIIDSPHLPIITNWHLVYLKNKNLSPAAFALLEHFKLNKKQIADDFLS